jgi:hypothetical protein
MARVAVGVASLPAGAEIFKPKPFKKPASYAGFAWIQAVAE